MSALSGNIKEDKEYLQVFWDLASEEDDVRLSASERLVRHLTAIAASEDANKQQEYQEYTLSRLVRGLASPRDAARQGFAVALCEALRVFPYGLEEVLGLVDEHTQTGGSLKGAEERDALFGKLFGIAAVLRADLLFSETNAAQAKQSLVSLTERVISLHQTKQWIQESTVETLLLLLSRAADQLLKDKKKSVVDEETLSALLAKVVALSNTSSFEANNEHQLSLLLGLQCWAQGESKLQALLAQALSAHKIPAIEISHMDTFVAALFHSTNKFPKFHKVWEYFMSFIVPMNAERELERAQTLDEAQQTALSVFTGFLDEHMWHASKEKRSVALKLVVKLVSLVPADALPLVLSSSFVRCLLLCRLKSQNLLFDFAGGVLRDLVRCVHGEADRTLALLSALSQHGGAQFDKRTQTRTVSGLLENLSFATTKEYLMLLCSLIAAPNAETAVRETETAEEEDKEANNSSTATTTLHSLVALARLSSPLLSAQEREDVQVAVLSVLLRMTCFGEGRTDTLSEAEPETETETEGKKKDKKKSKSKAEKKKEETEPLALQCIKLVEGESVAVSLSVELSTLAAQQFISLISDIALKSDKPSAVLVRVFAVLSGLARSPSLQERVSDKETENNDEDDEEDVVVSLPELAELTHTVLKELLALSLSASAQEKKDADNKEKDAPRVSRLASSAAALLATVSAHSLAGKEVARSIALQTAALLRALVEKAQQGESDEEKEEEEEEEDEEDALDLTLLEICTELFSLPSEQTVKGVRDAAKRVWAQLFPLLGEGVSQSFLDALVGQVTEAEEADNAAEGEGQREERATAEDDEENEEEEDDGGSDQEEEEEEEEEEETKAPLKRSAESNVAAEKASKKAKTANAIAQRESAEKEIVLGEEEMLGFLMEDDEEINAELGLAAEDKDEDAESDNEGVLVHTAEADAALIKMISLRKESRKQGLVAAKRKQVLLRSRLLDILEIFVQKQRSGELLFSLFVPLLLGAKKLFTSKLLQEIPEGRPFALRLQNLLEKQLCKKKFAIKFSDDEEKEADCQEELEVLSDLLQKMLASKLAPLRSVAQETLVAVARTIIASDSEACKQKVLELFQAITRRFLSLRRSNVPAKWLEDVITQRFPSFFLPQLFDDLVQSLQSTTTSSFVRNEVIEIANTVFKRMSSFDANTQSVLCAQLGNLCETLSISVQETITLLSTGATTSEDKEQKKDKADKGIKKTNNAKEIINGSTKKLRSTLTLVKTIVDTIARSKSDCSLSALTSTLENVKSFAAGSTGVSPAIAQLAEQSLQQIAKIAASKEAAVEKKKEGKESKKTDESVPSKKRKANEEVSDVKKSSKKK